MALDSGVHCHDHPRRAVAALRAVVTDDTLLDRVVPASTAGKCVKVYHARSAAVWPPIAGVAEPFRGDDRSAVDRREFDNARVDSNGNHLPIPPCRKVDAARRAEALPTRPLGAGEGSVPADVIVQTHGRIHLPSRNADLGAVQREIEAFSVFGVVLFCGRRGLENGVAVRPPVFFSLPILVKGQDVGVKPHEALPGE